MDKEEFDKLPLLSKLMIRDNARTFKAFTGREMYPNLEQSVLNDLDNKIALMILSCFMWVGFVFFLGFPFFCISIALAWAFFMNRVYGAKIRTWLDRNVGGEPE